MSEQKVSLNNRTKAVESVEDKMIETVDLSSKLSTLNAKLIYLRIDGDFRPGQHDIANFYYSFDGQEWTAIGTKNYRMSFDWQRFFMGSKFGIFCYATKKAGGYVDIDAFNYAVVK